MAERVRAAVALAQQGRLDEAVADLTQVVRLAPDFPQAHHNLGVALADQGRLAESAASLQRAVELRPDYAEAHLNLGNTLCALGRTDEALGHYRRAAALRSDSVDALTALGLALTDAGRSAEAAPYLRQATRLRPDSAAAHNALGLALADLGRWAEAEAAYERALALDPRHAEAHTNLATCWAHQGRLAEAVAGYDYALTHPPNAADSPGAASTRWNRSLALLRMGNYEEGFREYEWRWRRKQTPMRPMPRPLWDGSDPADKTILVWCEQGLGDALQFARYAAPVKQRGATVLLECPGPLLKVLGSCPGVDRLVPDTGPLPDFDLHVPLLSLPRLFGTTLGTVPADVPYLSADPEREGRWRQKLADVRELKVGVAWAGNPHHQWDRHRSVPLAHFAPLAAVPGVRLCSLQRGPGADQVVQTRGVVPVEEVLEPGLSDADAWAEVAALMKNLDVVVTVDTATAHLAGALGVPAWVALSALSDWRWMTGRADTPWYPTMRLFRQDRLGEWGPVFDRIAARLRGLRELATT